jgi:hypothetical protein
VSLYTGVSNGSDTFREIGVNTLMCVLHFVPPWWQDRRHIVVLCAANTVPDPRVKLFYTVPLKASEQNTFELAGPSYFTPVLLFTEHVAPEQPQPRDF